MTESLKNMLKSVDWSKMLSNHDARNALVGSALGGLMLGGASLFRERDPEESKLTPVGDALTGALLGGVAGYGIPKGLSLFRDSGTLAPDTDRIPEYGFNKLRYLGGAAGGGLAGTATAAGFTLPAMRRALSQYKERKASNFEKAIAQAENELEGVKAEYRVHRHLSGTSPDAGRRKALVQRWLAAKRKLEKDIPTDIESSNAKLKTFRGKMDAINSLSEKDWESNVPRGEPKTGFGKWLRNRTSGSRFAPYDKQLSVRPGDIKRVTALRRAFSRVGKYGKLGALAGLAGVGGWHALNKYTGFLND